MRRTHLRGHTNILKRLFVHIGGFNLGLLMRTLLGGLTAVHDGDRVYRVRQRKNVTGELPRAEHPVVRTHPVTGRKALFVNPNFTSHIVGMSALESDALLQMLYRHAERDEFKCRFKWRPNSIAFWDNRCTMHLAMWD